MSFRLATYLRTAKSLRPATLPAGARFYSFKAEDQPRIRIGSTAPNFSAQTTGGDIDFHNFIGDKWTVLFSHPADFTPVCTTELGAFAALKDEFTKRNAQLIALSADDLQSHKDWVQDIEDTSTSGKAFDFPIIADPERKVAFLYDMVDQQGFENINKGIAFTIRSVFIIDPNKKVRLFITYPASTGRNSSEILRVLDSLQLNDATGLVTPIDWEAGKDVIIPPSVKNEDAKKKYGDFKELKPYLRFTKDPVN
ncbi:thioredoxin-like protein [Yarrowia lipolytica]|jgi:alkyl hydroperoxide reductase subunit AhpC|uniref:YALI0F08195p n=2 Tax=Yarrowia lipolytica TaxID=4952 RepID=Q6C2G0_YARLI|nr:YALI0F08195p [Yarrowia lipolytica CLIB122]AOW06842.1 hypothetical protein YALI1_F11583g [Yarrowia lipolytica]KAB8284091.1 thioredoxin-like protein [Yarrowia lipolytica]KAE8173678.1 thioredoxin-like protein [Yarrowia lipolytica]KAJ8055962.1 thioredoxin-like protein [Yarrowia lipolytica]QNQ01273.1 Peroxiredoxin PRX1 [Yarrowia lipolytica]|eukprot:XP_505152.1 YALI0F08195p [Yarrowia lipolytica CLIB122]